MIEFHFKEGRSDTRRCPALLCVRDPKAAGQNDRPAEQTQPESTERDGNRNCAPKQQKSGKQQCGAAANPAQHTRGLFGIGLNERTAGEQQQEKGYNPEQKCRHGYFSCSISLATAGPRALRSARAVSPPAAYAAAARKSSASSCAAPGANRQNAPPVRRAISRNAYSQIGS
jgi:hypothetical protein